jgi:hypothetical protein
MGDTLAYIREGDAANEAAYWQERATTAERIAQELGEERDEARRYLAAANNACEIMRARAERTEAAEDRATAHLAVLDWLLDRGLTVRQSCGRRFPFVVADGHQPLREVLRRLLAHEAGVDPALLTDGPPVILSEHLDRADAIYEEGREMMRVANAREAATAGVTPELLQDGSPDAWDARDYPGQTCMASRDRAIGE